MTSTKISAPAGIDATYFLAKDLDRARKFYEEVVGLEFVRDYMGRFVEADLPDGSKFGLGFMPDAPWHPSGGIMFATPDFEEAAARVRAAGVPIRTEYEGENCTMLWFEDTEGNSLALHRRKPGAV